MTTSRSGASAPTPGIARHGSQVCVETESLANDVTGGEVCGEVRRVARRVMWAQDPDVETFERLECLLAEPDARVS